MEFSRQEYWSGLPLPSPGAPPDPEIEPGSLTLQADSLPSELPGKPTRTEFPAQSCRMYFHIDSISYKWQTSWTAGFIFSLPNCLVALCWQGEIHSILFLKEIKYNMILKLPYRIPHSQGNFLSFFFFCFFLAHCCFNSCPSFAVSTLWKRPWCWEGLRAGEGDDRGWDGWMASPTRWAWVWANSGSWWWTGRPGVLRFMESQRVGHDWATELNWTERHLETAGKLEGGGARLKHPQVGPAVTW